MDDKTILFLYKIVYNSCIVESSLEKLTIEDVKRMAKEMKELSKHL